MCKDKDDSNSKQSGKNADARVNLGRHRAQCLVCRHPKCEEIDAAWVRWEYPGQIAQDFGISRDSIYRHAHATGLFDKRQANFKMPYWKILERVDRIPFTGSNYVAVLNSYAKHFGAGRKPEAARPSDPKSVQTNATQQPDVLISDGSLAHLAEETESAISKEPQDDRDSVKPNNDQKAAEAVQPADPKAATQETAANERGKGILVGYIDELLDEMSGKEAGQGQNEEKELQCPGLTTVQ